MNDVISIHGDTELKALQEKFEGVRKALAHLVALEKKRTADAKALKDAIDQADAARKELIEETIPTKKDALVQRLQQIQLQQQEVDHNEAGRSTLMSQASKDIKEATVRLRVLIEDSDQLDLFGAPVTGADADLEDDGSGKTADELFGDEGVDDDDDEKQDQGDGWADDLDADATGG